MIQEKDYIAFRDKQVTVQALCDLHDISSHTAYRHLKAFQEPPGAPKKRLTEKECQQLKIDILEAIPHDREKGIKNVLEAYNLKSITQALSLLKVKSLSELRGSTPEFTKILQKLNLRLVGNLLYSPRFQGRYYPSRQITLDTDEKAYIMSKPKQFIGANIQRIKIICFTKGE